MSNESRENKPERIIMLMPKFAISMVIFLVVVPGQPSAAKKVFQNEISVQTTKVPIKESDINNYEISIEEPTRQKCPYDAHHPGEPANENAISNDEPNNQVEEHSDDVESMKWQLFASPVKMDDDLFSPIKQHLSPEEEPNRADLEPMNDDIRRNYGYELVNHKFRQNSGSKQHDHNNNNDLNNNWWTWRNTISYFPSGQAHLRKHWKAPPVPVPKDYSLEFKQPHFIRWPQKKDPPLAGAHPTTIAPVLNEGGSVNKYSLPVVTLQKPQSIEKTSDESSQLPVGRQKSINTVKGENLNEIDQQDQLHLREPIMMMHIDEQSIGLNQQQTEMIAKEISRSQVMEAPAAPPDAASILVPSLNEQRVKDSLLKAADLARQLSMTTAQPEVRVESSLQASTSRPSLYLVPPRLPENRTLEVSSGASSGSDSSDTERQLYPSSDGFDFQPISANNKSLEAGENWRYEGNFVADPSRMDPIFLGFGHSQKNDPINGNGRTQARLSCQFGDGFSSSNMSISVSS